MRRLRKFSRLPAAEKRLLLEAALLLGGARLGLRLLPFRTLRRLWAKLSKTPVGLRKADRSSVERIVWAVELAGRYVSGTCLARALAAQFLLLQQGYPALIHIGVVKEEGGDFLAHAWVESGGEVVIGGYELERYTPLTALRGETS